jgi:hypothetical protein
MEKSEALKSIKNFFMTSTVFKLRNIGGNEVTKEQELNTPENK